MTMIGVRLRDAGLSLSDMRELVRLAEDAGYDSAWLPEPMGRDAIAELIALLPAGRRIRLGTGIVPVFARLPTIAAAGVATAAALAPGRVILGVGIGHQTALEEGHGVPFGRPLQTTREFTEVARRLLAEGELSYRGEVFDIRRYRLAEPPLEPVPVFVAALRPRMLRLAGAVADGVLLNWADVDAIPQAVEHVRAGAEEAGRAPETVVIASYLRTCVTDDPGTVEDATRVQLAQYGSMVYYRRYFASIGFGDVADALERAWARGDADAAAASVPEAMIRALTVYGSAETCRARLQAYRDAGLDLPIVAPFPTGEPVADTFARTITGCA